MSALVLDRNVECLLPLTLDLPESLQWGDSEFTEICERNPDLLFEQDREGNVILMIPPGPADGNLECQLITQLQNWSHRDHTGIAYSSSTIFTLPNGAKRSPDASWLPRAAWEKLTAAEKEGLSPICPEFVIELRSRTDRLPVLMRKMEEYLENGAKLGLLIDPREGTVRTYRPGKEVETLARPKSFSADPEMPGLVFDLTTIWI